ncbi:GNAT family N-acetyltransferase [Vagococcus vulneris]|uniref:N-acetyltransferase domain-containing protein n=1 Tax=Vagococcus vulneris TaxID=1977869 RepID=A0A429ZZF2_9ENTE|nr:GNAT family N-acetyltransferase [Vagococcus vulneris]RST99374.1 hypothetical protein CBF37_05230 [Vagococcus vulneris]
MLFSSNRLFFKQITYQEKDILADILQDERLMHLGRGKTYTESEVSVWFNKIQDLYKSPGYSYWLITESSTKRVVGIAGLLPTIID